jgi:hypothetical protein
LFGSLNGGDVASFANGAILVCWQEMYFFS